MNITGILRQSFDILKKNPVIAAPPLAAGLIMLVLTAVVVGGALAAGALSGGIDSGDGTALLMGAGVGALGLVIFGSLLSLLAHGMTVAMAAQATDTGSTSLGRGFEFTMGRIVDFVVAAVIVGLAVWIGFMILFLPGLIAAWFLMFTFPAIVVDGRSGIEAVRQSVTTVKTRLAESATLFAVFIGLLIGLFIVNAILGIIPILGQIAALVAGAAFGAFLSLVMVLAYRELQGLRPESPAQTTTTSAAPPPPPPPPPPTP